jgi:hypothetical protein
MTSINNEIDLKNKTMKMKNWAVVGATDKKDKFGYKIYKRLKEYGYNVFAVNPNLKRIDGDKCYDGLSSIEEDIEVVDLVVNSSIGIKVMKEINENNIKYVWLQPGARSQEIREYAEKHNIYLIARSIYRELFLS